MLTTDLWTGAGFITIERRRKEIFKQMLNLVQNPELFARAHTAIVLAVLIIAENMVGNLSALQSHHAGLKTWLNNNGGLQRLHSPCVPPASAIIIISVLVKTNVPFFQTRGDFKAALGRFRLPNGRPWPWIIQRHESSFEYRDLYGLYMLNLVSEDLPPVPLDELICTFSTPGPIGLASIHYVLIAAIRKNKCESVCDYNAMVEFMHLMNFTSHQTRLENREQLDGQSHWMSRRRTTQR